MSANIIVLQIAIAWLYSHFLEYCAHRFLLHNHKNFGKLFRNHFGTHHYISRKNDMYDVGYAPVLSSKFEMLSLAGALAFHLPLLWFFPYAYLTMVYCCFSYYFLHRKAHTDVEWGRKWLPWHYEHHMGKNQHLNWGVRLPIIDILFGTRSTNSSCREV